MPTLSRRQFLQLGAASLFSLAFAPPVRDEDNWPFKLGRVTTNYLRVRARPSTAGKQVGWKAFDDVLKIYATVQSADKRQWHEIAGGYVESNEVQPVEERYHEVVAQVADPGFIGEVTVPFVDARRKPDSRLTAIYRLYYGSTFWVRDIVQDVGDQFWYKLYDERLGIFYYAPAIAIRPVPKSDFEPITPEITDKRIRVNLAGQRLIAYEGRREVFTTLISAGRLYLTADGLKARSWTPAGAFHIERKRPSRHMGYGEAAGSDYELPGVPWVSYFHWKGFAFHGTWWHNDFGRPRSAGCINMRPEEAHWLFRWSSPSAPPDQELTTGDGTAVEVVEG